MAGGGTVSAGRQADRRYRAAACRRRACDRRLGGAAAAASASPPTCSLPRARSPRPSSPTRPALMRALWVTLKRHADRAGARRGDRLGDRLPVRAEPDHRAQLLPLRHHPAGDADRRDRAADHHPGEEHAGRADHLRHHHRDLPDHLEHHRRTAQRRPGTPEPVRHQPRVAPAEPDLSAHPERAAVLLRGAARLQRAGADRRRGGRVRRRHRRPQRRPRLRDPASGLPARNPPHVRRAVPDHGRRHRAVPRDGRRCRKLALGTWHDSAVENEA